MSEGPVEETEALNKSVLDNSVASDLELEQNLRQVLATLNAPENAPELEPGPDLGSRPIEESPIGEGESSVPPMFERQENSESMHLDSQEIDNIFTQGAHLQADDPVSVEQLKKLRNNLSNRQKLSKIKFVPQPPRSRKDQSQRIEKGSLPPRQVCFQGISPIQKPAAPQQQSLPDQIGAHPDPTQPGAAVPKLELPQQGVQPCMS